MTLPKPYYDEDGITIYNADCRDILPHLQPVDLVLTDPPYGIGESAGKNKSRGNLAVAKDYGRRSWDSTKAESELILLAVGLARNSIIFGGNYYADILDPSSCWLVWDKENGASDFADAELAWTSLPQAVRLKRYMWNGMLKAKPEQRWHPTQKPLEIMSWCITQADKHQIANTICDPFMGSGTTLVAAKQLGRRAIGIDRERDYCDIAIKRLRQQVLPLGTL